MAYTLTPSQPDPQKPAKLVDAVEQWDSENSLVADDVQELSAVRFDRERLLVPFTPLMQPATLHYLKTTGYSGYVHCNDSDCLLCRVGYKKEHRDLLPVFDPVEQTVGVLPVAPSLRAKALRPQLAPVLRRMKDGEITMIAVRHEGLGEYTLTTIPVPGQMDGLRAAESFAARLNANQIDLTSVYPRLNHEEIIRIPQVRKEASLRGIDI